MDEVHLALSRKADAVALNRSVEAVRGRLGHAEDKTLEVEDEVKRLVVKSTKPATGAMADTFKVEELTTRVRSLEDNMIQCMENLADQFGSGGLSPRRSPDGPPANIPSWALDSIEEDRHTPVRGLHSTEYAEHDSDSRELPAHSLPTVQADDDVSYSGSGTETEEESDSENDEDAASRRLSALSQEDQLSRLSAVLEETEPEEGVDNASVSTIEIGDNTSIRTIEEESDADLRDSDADLRDTAADLRDSDADLKGTDADLRDSDADLRDSDAHQKDSDADLRDTDADLRDSDAHQNDSEEVSGGDATSVHDSGGDGEEDTDDTASADAARADLWQSEVERIRDAGEIPRESAASSHGGSISSERSGKLRSSQYERTGMTDDDISSNGSADEATEAQGGNASETEPTDAESEANKEYTSHDDDDGDNTIVNDDDVHHEGDNSTPINSHEDDTQSDSIYRDNAEADDGNASTISED
jgi:hypothetical protein